MTRRVGAALKPLPPPHQSAKENGREDTSECSVDAVHRRIQARLSLIVEGDHHVGAIGHVVEFSRRAMNNRPTIVSQHGQPQGLAYPDRSLTIRFVHGLGPPDQLVIAKPSAHSGSRRESVDSGFEVYSIDEAQDKVERSRCWEPLGCHMTHYPGV